MKRRCRAVALAAVVLGLSGCGIGDPRAYAQRPAVVQARTEAAVAAEAMLDRFTGVGEVLGTGREDWCDPGQSNPWVTTDYRFRCSLSRRALVAPAQADLSAAVAALQEAFERAGCPARYLDDAFVRQEVANGLGGPVSAQCGEVHVSVRWALTGWSNISAAPPPNGFDIEFEPFSAEAMSAAASATPFAWMVKADVAYVHELR